MRTLIYIVLSILLGMLCSFGQQSHTTTAKESGSTISIDEDISSFSGNEKSYFSTSDSEDTFKVRAKFNDRKTAKVKTYLLQELGRSNLTAIGEKLNWKVDYNGDTGYEVKLSEGSLRIFVNKELSSKELLNKIKTITKNIKEYTSGMSDRQRKEAAADREQDYLKRDADQKIWEAERLQREAERLRREADRIKREAKRKT